MAYAQSNRFIIVESGNVDDIRGVLENVVSQLVACFIDAEFGFLQREPAFDKIALRIKLVVITQIAGCAFDNQSSREFLFRRCLRGLLALEMPNHYERFGTQCSRTGTQHVLPGKYA